MTFKGFPPRFVHQPISCAYYASQFDVKVVGNSRHQELWIPAKDLDEFNKNIIGKIKVVKVYYGDNYTGSKIT